MSTVTISLPAQVIKKVDLEAKKEGFSTRSEFVRSLIRKYFSQELEFETFDEVPLNQVKTDLAKTGKYSQDFIESITKGLSKSSKYAG